MAMPDTTARRREKRRKGEDSAFIRSDKTFLGANETDIIALEREGRPRTTSRRISDERRKHPG